LAKLVSPITYQGGKQRIAGQILDIIKPQGEHFYDLCCGSGAISIELVNQGYTPEAVSMLDASPWGLFWQMIGDGSFNLSEFKNHIIEIPNDPKLIQAHLKNLSRQPADIATVYIYLLLQAGSFGGKSIWIANNKWQNCSFRSYWLPTATSNRRSHVNPMMPMPGTLYDRVAEICDKMYGVHGYYQNIDSFKPGDGIVYIDPPYASTTHYGHDFDLLEYVSKLNSCWVSEQKALSDNAYLITSTRKKGGISGDRKQFNEEWLSNFEKII
jgi:site-specific DNA-adenine methylase